MNKQEQNPELHLQVEKFIDAGELDEALTLLNRYEQKEDLDPLSRAYSHLLQCKILFWQGKYKKLLKLAEQTHKESTTLDNSFLTFDSFLFMISALARTEKLEEAIDLTKQGDELLKRLPKDILKAYKQREAQLAFIKGSFYIGRGDPNETKLALEYMEHSLALRENLGFKHEIAESLVAIAGILSIYKGELDHATELTKRSLVLAKESNKKISLANCFSGAAIVYSLRGDLNQSTIYFEQSLKLFKLINNKFRMAAVLNNMSDDYKKKGDLDRALECIVQATEINSNLGMLTELANNHDFLIQILIDKGDIKRVQMLLQDFEELNIQLKDPFINVLYLLNKALVLKTSSRAIKRGKAEEILKQLLETKDLQVDDLHIRFRILFNLCELLLTELRLTNDLEILEELNQYIGQLLQIAESSHSYWIIGETYLLKAKLALILLDLKEARLLLTQGQQLAEHHGLLKLAVKISNEHDELLDREKDWEIIKEKDLTIAERIKLASIDGIIDRLQGRKAIDPPELVDEEPILLLIMDKGGVPYFNHLFRTQWDHSDLFGSFMSAFNMFSDELFSKSIDRVRIGENTILINPIESFLACYVIKGQSYPALQKLTRFTEAIKENSEIWQALNKSVITNEMLQLDKPLALKTVIKEIFS